MLNSLELLLNLLSCPFGCLLIILARHDWHVKRLLTLQFQRFFLLGAPELLLDEVGVGLLFGFGVVLFFVHLVEVLDESGRILVGQYKFIAFTQQCLPQLLQPLLIALGIDLGLGRL